MEDPIEVAQDVMEYFDVKSVALEGVLVARTAPKDGKIAEASKNSPAEMPQFERDNLDEEIYSRRTMMQLKGLPGYTWLHDSETNNNGLNVINQLIPDDKRNRSFVRIKEYWIWQNVCAEREFPGSFGMFPFHLSHFDAVGFVEASFKTSPVLKYVRSPLFYIHSKKTLEQRKNVPIGEDKSRNLRLFTMTEECPTDGYSREAILSFGSTNNTKPDKYLLEYFHSTAFNTVKLDNEIYSRGHFRFYSGFPGYYWTSGQAAVLKLAGLFPSQGTKKMQSSEYWIWHNTNAQQSFAVFFGFFPFYLPHFDAEAFISAARHKSIVPAYLTSQLYQQHLLLREKYEGEEGAYRVAYEEEKRRSLIAAHQRVIRFPLTDEHSMVHYEDSEAKVQECTLQQAQFLLQQGYFTSQMKFVVAPKGTDVKKYEWRVFTLEALIERNGREMPFVFSTSCHSEQMSEVKESNEMIKEMRALTDRRAKVMGKLQQMQSRSAAIQQEIQRMAAKFPVFATRAVQTHAVMGLAAKMETSEVAHPQFVPKVGVDPLAVLKTCSKTTATGRVLSGDAQIAARLDQLRMRFDRCDKKALVLRTASIMNKKQPAWCRLCELKMESTSTFIEHVTCKKHANRLTAVCEDSLDFWFDAIGQVTKSSSAAAISPIAILSFCQNLLNPHPDLQQAAATMQRKLRQCDKKALDGEAELRALFNTPISCAVCIRRVFIDKPANLIAHFATAAHISAATKNGGQMHAEVIDFWMNALDRAMVAQRQY